MITKCTLKRNTNAPVLKKFYQFNSTLMSYILKIALQFVIIAASTRYCRTYMLFTIKVAKCTVSQDMTTCPLALAKDRDLLICSIPCVLEYKHEKKEAMMGKDL